MMMTHIVWIFITSSMFITDLQGINQLYIYTAYVTQTAILMSGANILTFQNNFWLVKSMSSPVINTVNPIRRDV